VTPRVHAEWRNRVAAEYRSAALAAGVLRGAIVAGLPEDLLHTALRIVRDELDHASLSHGALVALGGDDTPVPLHVGDLAGPPTGDLLGDLVDSVVRDFCLGETFAVPLFHAMRQDARHPAVVPVLTRILADEAIHRQFGWDALDALLQRVPGVRERLETQLPGWLGGVRAAYAESTAHAPPLSEDERGAGLLAPARYRELFWDTVRTDVARRFGARGIAVPREYAGVD
jgi:hypothetical protein